MARARSFKGGYFMIIKELLPEISEVLQQGMQKIEFGKFGIVFTVHEGRIVSVESTFTNNIVKKMAKSREREMCRDKMGGNK
jgi:hypothetical protein